MRGGDRSEHVEAVCSHLESCPLARLGIKPSAIAIEKQVQTATSTSLGDKMISLCLARAWVYYGRNFYFKHIIHISSLTKIVLTWLNCP